MAWRYHGGDNKIEVVVEPSARDDITALAAVRPVWIVDTPGNRPAIDASWLIGAEANLCEVSRCPVDAPNDRLGNLLDILGNLDDHYTTYDIVVHGLEPNEAVVKTLEEEGFRITETTPNGFVALRIPGLRDRLIGRG